MTDQPNKGYNALPKLGNNSKNSKTKLQVIGSSSSSDVQMREEEEKDCF